MAGEHAADAAVPDAEPGGAAQSTTPGAPGGVDYERMAADWDRGLAVMAPVTGAVLAHLPALAAGDLLLDVGCGTGEPGLSAARRDPGVRLLGVDTAAAMVEVARYKAQQEQLAATFEVMAAGELTLADGSVGAVVSRFALLAFPAAGQDGAREVARVLAPGGPYSIATWDRLSLNTLFDATLQTLREHASPGAAPDLGWLDDLAAPGRREGWLCEAGLAAVDSESFTWTIGQPNLASLWEAYALGGALAAAFAALEPAVLARAQDSFADRISVHRRDDGSYAVPHTCRVLWGRA